MTDADSGGEATTFLKGVRPCPFCGSLDLKLEGGRVVCSSCRAMGPTKGFPTPVEDEEARACDWWSARDLKATMAVYRTGGRSVGCPFCGCEGTTLFECSYERSYAALCKACGARGPPAVYDLGGQSITRETARGPVHNMWVNRDYMTARNALYGKVIL